MQKTEIKIGNRNATIELISQTDSIYHVKIDGKEYHLDVYKVEQGVYSIINNGQSINMEMIEGNASNKYIVNTLQSRCEVEVIDALARYRNSSRSGLNNEANTISTPMPGKIVKVLVKKGDTVEKGQTVVVVAAMKMESEYKAPFDGVVVAVKVKEGDTIEAHQHMVELKKDEEK